jgi:hypothetical protein
MAVPNRKQADPADDRRPLDLTDFAVPHGDAPPHALQRMLIERLGASSGVAFPRQPRYAALAEQLVANVSRIGGVMLFAASLILVVTWVF